MAKFDLKGILSQESRKEMEIPEQKVVYRNPEDLVPSNENFYDTEKIAKLKESIKLLGLLQPLLIENRDGKDYIIAGHSRRKCCLELIEQGEGRFQKVPCVYRPKTDLDTGNQDEIIRKIMIIQSNTYREKTDWEKMTEALQMEELVKELRKNVELEGKTRDITAHLIGASSSQIGRYRSISTNLSDDLMAEFKKNHINLSTTAELAGLKPEYQHQAYEIFQREGNISINDAKVLKARQEQENLPGQMTIEEALHPVKPQEIDTVIPVDIQIDRFYESLRKNVETYIRQSDRNMTIYMLSALYGSVRVRNGYLNYQGKKEGILFNPGSNQEELVSWKDFSERLIAKYGKKKQVKTAPIFDGDEEKTEKCAHRPEYDCTLQEAQKLAEGDGEGCNEKCCWNCKIHRSCAYECNASAHRPEESCQPAAEPQDEKQHDSSDRTDDPAEILPENWPEYLKDIPVPTETALASYLYDQERDLKQILDIEKEEPGLPYMTIMQQQMVVAGLRLLQNCVKSMKEPEQPPLPEMKNNDQRKEWLRNHKAWGLWYTDPHTKARYYKYDFDNGARLIAEEYDPEPKDENSWWVPTESCYLHLVGGPEPERAGGVPKWTYHPKYNKFPNSETELIEFLKEIQK